MKRRWMCFVVSFFGITGVCAVIAQPPPIPHAYAIVNVRVFIRDGRIFDRATVLIRDGVIEAVGENISVPSDAEIIKGEVLCCKEARDVLRLVKIQP